MKRIGGAADRLGAADGRPRRRLQPRTGPAHGARTCAASASTSTSRRCSTSPAPAGRSPKPNAASARAPAQVAATAIPFADGAAGGRRRGHRQALPRARGGAARTPTSRCSGSASRRRTLREVDEAPYRRFVAAGGDLVMLSTAIYPALLAAAGRLLAPDRDRRAARAARLRGRLDHRRARNRRGRGLRRPGQGRRRGGAAPAPTCSSSPTSSGAAVGAPGAGRRSCARGALDRDEFEASAQRVLDLRARAGAPLATAGASVADRVAVEDADARRGPSSLAAYIAVSASETIDVELVRGSVAEHRDADAGGDRFGLVAVGLRVRGSRRRSPRPRAAPPPTVQRGRTIANSSPPSRASDVALAGAARAARRRSPRSGGRRPGGRGCR